MKFDLIGFGSDALLSSSLANGYLLQLGIVLGMSIKFSFGEHDNCGRRRL